MATKKTNTDNKQEHNTDIIYEDVVSKVKLDRLDNCSACGGTHENMEFVKLAEPFSFADEMWDYSGTCPETNIEIVLNYKEEVEEAEAQQTQ